MMDIRDLFKAATEVRASDLHLTEHSPPLVRIDGELQPLRLPPLTREETKRLIYSVLSDRHQAQFEQEQELDISVDMGDVGRFRVNVHSQRGSVEAAFRLVSLHIRTLAELGLPQIATELTMKPNGLVLLTGPTGVGKTTTLAAMVDHINTEKRYVVVVIEDPIEYVHQNKRSIIKQREVYSDTQSFAKALTHALRQDPNVIVVGELRDLESISTALTAAETGHLVLATLHTPDAPQTIDRIIDVFPPYQQQQVKVQLADCLQGAISQILLPRSDGPGRVLATEVMVATTAIRNLIREHKVEQIPTLIQTGAQYGMHTMDSSIKELYQKQIISYEVAVGRLKDLHDIRPI
ncbi:MAG: type IV pilus twitching motility protein PilT [Candidatus Omnitrophica bacterium]|nr:type IV pilus twitching motility protein PilT [Candidatus Omnitrophota bacterium]